MGHGISTPEEDKANEIEVVWGEKRCFERWIREWQFRQARAEKGNPSDIEVRTYLGHELFLQHQRLFRTVHGDRELTVEISNMPDVDQYAIFEARWVRERG
jgi:hypothetical protein